MTQVDTQSVFDRLRDHFGADAVLGRHDATDPWIKIAAGAIVEVGTYLRDADGLRFEHLNDLCFADYLATSDPRRKEDRPRVEVVYQLSSYELKHRLTLKVVLPRWKDDKPGELPEVPSVSGVWAIADWHEREAYDLGGVRFVGHPHLTRILTSEDWVGHPLRKDYEMPLEYHGIRCR
ncbi:MAG: NADH-quinone oxidoreductase subunit C [Planctomycetota bacterium]